MGQGRKMLMEGKGEEERRDEGREARRLEEVGVNGREWIRKHMRGWVGGGLQAGMEGEDVVVYEEQPGEVVETQVAGGGRVHMGMEGEDVVVYEEQPGEVVTAFTHAPFLHNITHCSPPIHGQRINQRMDLHIRMGVDHFELWDVSKITYLHDPVRSIQVISERIYQWMDLHICMGVDHFELWDVSKITNLHDPVRSIQVISERIYQWMDLHIRMGVDHFSLYDVGGVDPQLRTLIAPLLDGGIAEVTDFRNLVNYESWYHGQERVPTPLSVNHFLMPYEGMPYVTHGSLWWDLDRCLPSQGPDEPRWPLERMLWHGPGVFCKARDNHTKPTMCLDHYGHRKLFVDPRRVRAVMNHVVQEPTIGGGGADLSTDVLRHHHFHVSAFWRLVF
ncbi:unnamed protein product [Closterium sp. NIES-64]|nr:unnamed protein product [Closterium sp. NIES-64]